MAVHVSVSVFVSCMMWAVAGDSVPVPVHGAVTLTVPRLRLDCVAEQPKDS